jgi:hypothetical protein
MKVDLTTVLPCRMEDAVTHVMTFRLLQYVAYPLISFSAVAGSRLPEKWTEGTHRVRVWLFGIIPLGRQAVEISRPAFPEGFSIRDAGHSTLIPVWDHVITIEPHPEGVRYRDRVDVSARVLTPLIWLFARIFYGHRQRRWRRLVARGFRYEI